MTNTCCSIQTWTKYFEMFNVISTEKDQHKQNLSDLLSVCVSNWQINNKKKDKKAKVQFDSGLAACTHRDLIHAETFKVIILQCSQNRTAGYTWDPGVHHKLDTISVGDQKCSVLKKNLAEFPLINTKLWEGVTPAFSIYTCISCVCFLTVWLGLQVTWHNERKPQFQSTLKLKR